MTKFESAFLLATLFIIAAFSIFAKQLSVNPVLANGVTERCPDGWIIKIPSEGPSPIPLILPYTLNYGSIITSVCIKSATDTFIYSSDVNACYSVTGINTNTVTVGGGGTSSSCQSISHITFYSDPGTPSPSSSSSPSPSPSPSPSTSPSPSASSSPSPSTSPSPSPSPSVSPSPSPSISPSPSPSGNPEESPSPSPSITDVCANIEGVQTSVPDGLHLDASGLNCVSFSDPGNPSSPSAPTPQVLGTSTLAATGTFEENLYLAIMGLGAIITTLGAANFRQAYQKA